MRPAANFELIIVMFLVVLGLHYLARRLSLPPAAALIVGGCAVAFVPGVQRIEIDPELVLVLFLPPLLMDGAWFTAVAPFRRHTAGILSLAVGAVLFTTAVVAIVTRLLMPQLPWPPASRLARSCRRPMPYPPAPCCSGSSCHAG